MMKNLLFLFVSLSLQSIAQNSYPTIGKIERFDAAFDSLVAKDAKIEVLASGFNWSEGPVWVKKGGYLLFSDIPENTIFKWKAQDGITPFLKPSGYTGILPYSAEPGSNGLIINQKGELVACEHGDRRVSAMPFSSGGKRTLSDNFNGKRFNSPNDIVQHSSGAYYFTDPCAGMPKGVNDPTRETDIVGVYRIGTDGKTTLVVKDLLKPNGLAFSPDEKILYVAQSLDTAALWMAYPVNSDGSLGKGKVFLEVTQMIKNGLVGRPDGLKIDKKGNLWASGPGGVVILSPDAKLLGRIIIGERVSNVAFGEDGSTLYLTADMYLCRIKTLTIGVGF
jgi:gluconolactonase